MIASQAAIDAAIAANAAGADPQQAIPVLAVGVPGTLPEDWLIVYTQAKERKTTKMGNGRRTRGTARIRYIDSGSGKGKVALEHTVAVGRVYMERMEQQGEKVRDAERPPGDPG